MQSSRTPSARRRFPAPGRCEIEASRLAFTLLELLIAISIIAILASLILTVAGSASIKAHNAQVSADILTLSTGISAFKQRYGVEPPSSITLYEQGTGAAAAGTGWAADPRSMSLIRQIWPQFDFNYTAEGGAIDINGNGTTNDTIALSGTECLVFFLGGIPANPVSPATDGGAPSGFSLNPVDPFNVSGVGASRQVVGTNRERFSEFDIARLFLYPPANNTASGVLYHSMNTYRDTLSSQTQPYLYLSSYGGQGYNVAVELASPPLGTFTDIYRQGPNGYSSASPSTPWNPNSYQIISPGGDQQYGVGGEFETANANTLLVGSRAYERDNITNFVAGTLAP